MADGKGPTSTFWQPTQEYRKRLLANDPEIQRAGLETLQQKGTEGSFKKWWAFEGWTSFDCWLETDSLLLFIEGKRTEDFSKSTGWYPARNQLVRNVEVAAEQARKVGKDYAVLVCAEHSVLIENSAFDESLPHLLSPRERDELRRHYLGSITWEQLRAELCPEMELPVALDDAIEVCLRHR